MQFLSAAGTHGQPTGIAWWAHIGGFVFGIIFLKLFLKAPEIGITGRLRYAMSKRKTPRLQVIRPAGTGDDPNLHGTISITPREAQFGTLKLVNIPWGFQKRLFRVRVPPGVTHGATLRLAGMGKKKKSTRSGDLYLKVSIHPV